jgi:Amt family ammonium transporter
VFGAIKATIGLRVSPEQEEAGLDIIEHGMYGYPEQFIESPDGTPPLRAGTPAPASTAAMAATAPRPAASET